VSGEVIGRPDVVPYIAKWSGETTGPGKIVQRKKREGIAYEKERSFDRDEHGVLWTRAPSEPGKGRAEFGKVHSLRQRVAMGALLCQVCGNRADRNEDGVLWLIDAHPDDPILRAGVPERTTHPPVCEPCAEMSLRACPHLRKECVVLRVREFEVYGVNGALYRPGVPVPVPRRAAELALGDFRIPWMLGSQVVLSLTAFSVV
jgi:hypothetical protein